jgi:dihydrofolate reductase
MGKVVLEITMSIDGYAAGPNVGFEHPMGEGGERLHDWLGEGDEVESKIAERLFTSTGAFVMGRRMFDVGEQPWGEDGTFGKPVFVVTHRERDQLVKGPTTFTFVTDGIDSALGQAREAAGEENVIVMGGPDIAQQYLEAGLVDELRLHVVPVLLGAGTRLFDDGGHGHIELRRTGVIETSRATHLDFSVVTG